MFIWSIIALNHPLLQGAAQILQHGYLVNCLRIGAVNLVER